MEAILEMAIIIWNGVVWQIYTELGKLFVLSTCIQPVVESIAKQPMQLKLLGSVKLYVTCNKHIESEREIEVKKMTLC